MGTTILSLARMLALKEMMYAGHSAHSTTQRACPSTAVWPCILLEHLICMRVRKATHFRADSEHSIRGSCTPTPAPVPYQDASSHGKSDSTQVQKTPVTSTLFNKHLDHSQSQLAGTGWEGSFLCLIGAVIHQKHRSQRSARHRCFVWLFPGNLQLPWEPKPLPWLWFHFLHSFSLKQDSSLRHPHVDTSSRTRWVL